MKSKTCSVKKCDGLYYARRFCKKHYAQTLRHGRLTPELERDAVLECPAPDCGRTSEEYDFVRGHCRKHARQIDLYGKLTPEAERTFGVEECTVKRCGGDVRAKGLCASHYNKKRWREKKDKIMSQRRAAREDKDTEDAQDALELRRLKDMLKRTVKKTRPGSADRKFLEGQLAKAKKDRP